MQLVSIVRGLSASPKIILLDEVFTSLDEKNRKIIYSYLSNFILKKEALVIFTSHGENHEDINFEELCLK